MEESLAYSRWWEALRSTIALWFFVLLMFLPLIIRRHEGEDWTGVAIDCSTFLYSIVLAMLMYLASRATMTMPAWMRLPLRAGAVIATAAVNTVLDLLFQGWIGDHVATAWQTLPTDFVRAYSSMLNYILVFGANMVLFHVNHARRAAIAQERRLAQADKAAQAAQLQALRYQLNPHFLFNALNSISSLIVTRRNDDAEAMTERLSTFLRNSLNADPAGLTRLDDELALTEEYLQIESVRLGDRLDVTVHCADDACNAIIPSFLVQPLVENAVKHGVARSREPVHIQIDAAIEEGWLRITVANELGEKDADMLRGTKGAGFGIASVRRRLENIYGGAATLNAGPEHGRYIATILIPRDPPRELTQRPV